MGHGLQGFGAYGAKIIELYKYVSDSSIPPTDLVLLTDAFDVVMDAQAIASIPDKFAAVTNSSSSSSSSSGGSLAVLFAAERACWPDITRWSCYPQLQHTPYRYLNAGGLVGHVGYLRALLQPLMGLVSSWTDDQQFYSTEYLALREQHGFHIDSGCKVFQTLNQVDLMAGELLFDAGRGGWFNVETNSYPVLMHGNGNTKDAFFGEVMPKVAGGWHWLNNSQTR
ncbi:hypothetical protein OEZ86_003982 [Tetradesmus obliquus]|nr:hypothetical protein OEZ86_003982 [Tetradesmus obliquus]